MNKTETIGESWMEQRIYEEDDLLSGERLQEDYGLDVKN